MACVRSGISGWVIGLLIRGRAGAERRAANSWSPVLADGEARRRFLFGTWRSAVAELFGNSRSQQLAGGKPSDVLALCWILESAARDRSLNLLGKGAALTMLLRRFLARARAAPRPAVSIRRRRRGAIGDCSARADRNRWPRGGCGVCALWHFRLGDRALDPWACGRRTARGQFLVAGAGRRRGPPPFSVWDLEIGGGGALRQQPLATAGRRAAFGCARTLLDFGIGRARPLLESALKGGRVTTVAARFLARARAAPRPAVSIRRRRRAAIGDCSARADRNRWPRGGCGVCALWHFRLGDRALDPWACGRRTARGQFLVAGAGRRRGPPPFSVWDLEIGGGGALRQQPLATAGRRAAFGCARTLLDFGIGRARPLLEICI